MDELPSSTSSESRHLPNSLREGPGVTLGIVSIGKSILRSSEMEEQNEHSDEAVGVPEATR
jgi:hypothetical protein